MAEESNKESTKKRRKTEREEKEPKAAKKRRKSGAAGDHNDTRQNLPDSLLESEKGPTITREGGNPSSAASRDHAVSEVKVSKKRKKTTYHASLPSEPATVETDVIDHEPKKSKKRDKCNTESYPDPAADESLLEQSRKALSYAYERYQGHETWKFNKARQNWLLRHVWSEQAIPEAYIPLVIGYLAGIKGGARKALINECISKTSTAQADPVQHPQPSNGRNKTEQSRAQSILDTLRHEESSH